MQSNKASCAKGLVNKKKSISWEFNSQPGPTFYNGAEKGSDLGGSVMSLSREIWFSSRVKSGLGN